MASTIGQKLKNGQNVLWLVPGGSSIAIAVKVSRKLTAVNLKNLTVTLTDERYGEVRHPDSNWRQLRDAGFTLTSANFQPVLLGKDFNQTAIDYSKTIENDFKDCDFKLGFIGIGADGHTAGIKPASPAVTSDKWAVGFRGDDFLRLTITSKAISQLDEVVSYAIGRAKWPVLDQLEKDLPIERQPAQCLKTAGKLTIYNDYKGDQE